MAVPWRCLDGPRSKGSDNKVKLDHLPVLEREDSTPRDQSKGRVPRAIAEI